MRLHVGAQVVIGRQKAAAGSPVTTHFLTRELSTEDVNAFQNYLRMPPVFFDEILERVTPSIERKDTKYSSALPPGVNLSVILIHVATGDNYSSLSYAFQLPVQCSSHLRCKAIVEAYKNEMFVLHVTPDECGALALRSASKFCYGLLRPVTFCCVHPFYHGLRLS